MKALRDPDFKVEEGVSNKELWIDGKKFIFVGEDDHRRKYEQVGIGKKKHNKEWFVRGDNSSDDGTLYFLTSRTYIEVEEPCNRRVEMHHEYQSDQRYLEENYSGLGEEIEGFTVRYVESREVIH